MVQFFFILAILFYFLFKKQYQYLILTTCYLILAFLIISPLLYQQWLNSKISLTEVKNWFLVLGKVNLKNLLLIPVKFCVGRVSFYPKWLYWLVAGGWTTFVLYQILKIKNQNYKSKIKIDILFFLGCPIFLGFVVSFFTPLLQYFRFLYLVPFMCLLLVDMSYKSNRIYVILAFGFFLWSILYLLNPIFHREDWKGLAYYLRQKKIEKVYMISSSSDPLIYYYPNVKINSLKNCYDRSIFLKTKKFLLFLILQKFME